MIRLAQAAEYLETALGHAQAGRDDTGRPTDVTPAEWRKLQAGEALYWLRKGALALGEEKPPRKPKTSP